MVSGERKLKACINGEKEESESKRKGDIIFCQRGGVGKHLYNDKSTGIVASTYANH